MQQVEDEVRLASLAGEQQRHEWHAKQVQLVRWIAQVRRENDRLKEQLAQAEAHHQAHHAREQALRVEVERHLLEEISLTLTHALQQPAYPDRATIAAQLDAVLAFLEQSQG
jgi:hypothetical protein